MKKKIQILCVGFIILNSQLITHNSFSQNVGINADGANGDANTMLDIKGTNTSSSSFGLKVKDSAGDNKLVVRSDGFVGVGTSSPRGLFDIRGNNAVGNGSRIYMGATGSINDAVLEFNRGRGNIADGSDIFMDGSGIIASHASVYLNIDADNTGSGFFQIGKGTENNLATPFMNILNGGNVGIGTTSPDELFQVLGETNTDFIVDVSTAGQVRIGTSLASSTELSMESPGNAHVVLDNNDNGTTHYFSVRTDGESIGADELFRVQEDGNVGIGTTSPGNRLHVSKSSGSSGAATLISNTVNSASYDGLAVETQWAASGGAIANFSSAGVSRLYIEGSGNVGIGTSSPVADLEIKQNDATLRVVTPDGTTEPSIEIGQVSVEGFEIKVDNTSSRNLIIKESGSTSETAVHIDYNGIAVNEVAFPNGNVGIGTTAPSAQLHTTGTVRFAGFAAGTLTTDASGNVTASSDERLKNIQGEYKRGLEDLKEITPISYTWKESTGYDTERIYSGFSAQNIQQNIPEAVGMDDRGYLTLSDRPIIAALVNAIKEQQQIIENQKRQNEELETRLIQKDQSMELRIKQLEEYIKTVDR